MQDKSLFEYAVIRVVPKVEREEFLNVGVILFCPSQKFLQAKFRVNEQRLCSFAAEIDMTELRNNLEAFAQISLGVNPNSPIAKLDMASRFRWQTATRSTVLQTSKVHPGFCSSPAETLEKLFKELVI
ncbi:MAG: DUF3037 domain-containing protein [Bacteroidota bacterium]